MVIDLSMLNKIKEIKDEVIKVYPEIMEFGFGCEVHQGEDPYIICGKNNDKNGSFMLRKKDGQAIFDSAVLGANWHIIGKPITLEHILGVIEKHIKKIHHSSKKEKHAIIYNLNRDKLEILRRWKLNKPLSEQPPETIDFIHPLIINKN